MTPPLSIGDEVEIIGPDLAGKINWLGQKFKIERISGIYDNHYTANGVPLFPASSLRLVPKFKKGDLVEIIGPSPDGTTREIGEEFTITQTYEDFSWMADDYRDCYSDTGRHPYKASSLRLVEELKIGNWVEVVGASITGNTDDIGKRFIIEEIDDPSWPSHLKGYSHHGWMWSIWPASSLRKLAPEEIQQNQAIETVPGIRGKYANIDGRLSAIESRLDKLGPSHSELLGDVEALAEKMGAIEKRLTSIEKRQREQHERMDRFMQDYREHKDFDFDMHDRIKALEGERPEVCEPAMNDIGAIAAIASFGPVPECVAAFIRHETEEAEKRKLGGDCHPNTKPIRITISSGANDTHCMTDTCPGECVHWAKKVLDGMREA